MRVTALPEAESRPRRVAIGTFDGVHLGHRAVIAGCDTVLTFDPHPLAVLRPRAAPRLLDSFPIKRDLIAGLGVEELVAIPFDTEFSKRSAEQFVEEVLIARLGAVHVSVGEDFRFGHGARGDAGLLRGRGEFETRVVALVEAAGERVSSEHIRRLVAAGEVERAATFLARPFMLEGEVVHGDRRGHELGMPTANMVPDPRLVCPAHGVYAATAGPPDEEPRPAAVSVGVRPTFEAGGTPVVEAYVLDFEGDLYGQTLRISFLERLRGEGRFDSAQALVEQMHEDVERVREAVARTGAAG